MKKLKLNLIVSSVFQIVTIAYGFILPRLLISKFGSDVYGLTQSIKQFLGLISFLDLGVGQVARSALYKPLAERNSLQISRVMVESARFYRTLAYILLGYIGALLAFYPLIVNRTFDWLFVAALIAVMSLGTIMQYFIGVVNEQLLHADQRSYLIYGVHIGCIVANLLLCLLMIYLDCSIHLIMLATAIVFLTKPLFYVFYIRKRYHIDWSAPCDKKAFSQKWNGMAQHVSAVVLDGTDNVVLTLFSSLSNVSVYSIYYMVIGSLQGFYQTVAVGIQSAAGAIWAKQNSDDINKMFVSTEFYLHTITLFLFGCAGVLIVPFVRVYTDGLTDGNYIQPVFALLFAIAYGIRCLRTPYNIWILAAGHFKQTQRCHIIAAALNLVISILMVWKWGLIGVAIGTLSAMCYQTLWLTVYAAKNLIKCSSKHIIKRYAVDAIVILLIVVATSWIRLTQISYWGWFIMAVKVGAIVAVCVVLVSILFYKAESLQIVKKFVRKSAGKS